MTDRTKTPVTITGAERISLNLIEEREGLMVRGFLSPHHVTELVQAVRRGSTLPPVLVWKEQDDEGEATGKMVILDGRHRIAALRKAKPKLVAVNAKALIGTKAQALLAATEANSKVSLPLTLEQRTWAAWAVVRMDPGYTLSKTTIARQCGVGTTTVAKMRSRWKHWPDDQEPSGNWWRDSRDQERDWGGDDWNPDEAEQQRQAEIDRVAREVRKALGNIPETDSQKFAEVISRVAGHRLPLLLDWYRGDGEEAAPYAWKDEADSRVDWHPSTGLQGASGHQENLPF